MADFIAQVENIGKYQMLGVLAKGDNKALANQLRAKATEFHVNLEQLPGLEASKQGLLNTVLLRADQGGVPSEGQLPFGLEHNSFYENASSSSSNSSEARNIAGGRLLSPEELAEHVGLALALKTKSTPQHSPTANDKPSQQKSASYLFSDSVPDKIWRVSSTFRMGGYKKVRLSLDNDNNLGIFSVQYVKEALSTPLKSQSALSLAEIINAEQILRQVESPLATADGTEHAFVDQKSRIWAWRPFYSIDVADLSDGLRSLQGTKFSFLKLMLGMAEDVARIHEKKLMLLDIKPENFLYDPAHGITFGDFDFVHEQGTMSQGAYCGTRGYMAPEMLQRAGSRIGLPADIFSLGQSFVSMTTGNTLSIFNAKKPDILAAAYRELRAFDVDARVDSVSETKAATVGSLSYAYNELFSLHETLGDFVFDQMLNKNPDKRPSAQQVVAALRRAVPNTSAIPENGIADIERTVAQEGANLSLDDLLPQLHALPALP